MFDPRSDGLSDGLYPVLSNYARVVFDLDGTLYDARDY